MDGGCSAAQVSIRKAKRAINMPRFSLPRATNGGDSFLSTPERSAILWSAYSPPPHQRDEAKRATYRHMPLKVRHMASRPRAPAEHWLEIRYSGASRRRHICCTITLGHRLGVSRAGRRCSSGILPDDRATPTGGVNRQPGRRKWPGLKACSKEVSATEPIGGYGDGEEGTEVSH